MITVILMRGERSYYLRLKELYRSEGIWELQKELVLQELSQVYMTHAYAALAEEGEWERLFGVVQASPSFITLSDHCLEVGWLSLAHNLLNKAAVDAQKPRS